jgi:hypothetical protein
MEHVSQNLNEIARQIEPSEQSLAKSSYTPRESQNDQKPHKTYLAVVMRIVRYSLELANQPPLEDDALDERAAIWAETVFGIIPENRLITAFRRATADHNSTFPMNAYDLKNAFDRISAEEGRISVRDVELRVQKLDEESRLQSRFECKKCFNCGWETVWLCDETGRQYRAAKKCYECRYWDNYSAKLKAAKNAN